MEQAGPNNPYYPPGVEIAGYSPNETALPILLASFGGVIAAVVGCCLLVATRIRPALPSSDRLVLCWFVLCAFLHCFFEGYFVLGHGRLAGSQSLFAQLWKEYALSDSRYLASDPFMLCIESITFIVWGPLCVAIAACIVHGSSLRYPLQVIMSVGHLYGVALYYGTCFFEGRQRGVSHSRPEFQYYWVYYVGLNFPWVAVPSYLLVQGTWAVWRGLRVSDGTATERKDR